MAPTSGLKYLKNPWMRCADAKLMQSTEGELCTNKASTVPHKHIQKPVADGLTTIQHVQPVQPTLVSACHACPYPSKRWANQEQTGCPLHRTYHQHYNRLLPIPAAIFNAFAKADSPTTLLFSKSYLQDDTSVQQHTLTSPRPLACMHLGRASHILQNVFSLLSSDQIIPVLG